jgi:Organic solute transporter Ostalpha
MSCIVATGSGLATCSQQQSLGVASGFLTCLCLGLYWRFIRHEARICVGPLRRVLVLSHRIALVIPAFALISIVAYIVPEGLPVLTSAQALAEGAALWAFFKMIVHAVGPDDVCVRLIQASPAVGCLIVKYPMWRQCQQSASCLRLMRETFLQFFLLRPVLMLIEGAFEIKYLQTHDMKLYSLSTLFNALAIISLVITLPAIVRIYEIFGALMPELGCLKKVIFVKTFIFAWVVQNNAVKYFSRNDGQQATFLRMRIFAFVVLVELLLLSLAIPFLFGTRESLVSRASEVCSASSDESTPSGLQLLSDIVSSRYNFDANDEFPAFSIYPHVTSSVLEISDRPRASEAVILEIESPLQREGEEEQTEA